MVKYSAKPVDEAKTAKTRGSDVRVHFKNTRETANAVKGLSYRRAVAFLENVLAHKECVPYTRFNGHVGRTGQAKAHRGVLGRWPTKSVEYVLSLLKNAASNATSKKLSLDDLVVSHVSVQQAMKHRRRTYRAHGRIGPYVASPSHIELFLTTKDAVVARPKDGKVVKNVSNSGKLVSGTSA
ncbi:60S large subunit ribosomal protein uL22 (rpL17) [Andalucia godoyi]|uniref:60S large subunit ribosomal protein uL22 (RpL17) n=1 Tax=Andalucia godoyi TaxID=505711 RepID=A0A8K0F486_ANDGO|nr:60S large subunit ribosomal protein uL22 (rpL17) [Andalucia godoyi]WCZ58589.1 60S ribosomal protein L17 [Andalucia godoyi]|eukprot:ANDGO_05583.mRNA.1 60S large subunit ribosomal protein uL22 (rpL17)